MAARVWTPVEVILKTFNVQRPTSNAENSSEHRVIERCMFSAASSVAFFAFSMHPRAFLLKRFACFGDGNLRATVNPTRCVGCGPAHRVSQDQLHVWIEKDRIHFVSGGEIENFAVAAFPSATGAKNIAAFKPRNENNFIRRRNGEWFAVHLAVFDFEITIDAACDGMRGIANPNAFFLSGFTPGERATRAHEALENFRVMRRVQGDETHTLPDAFDHTIDNGIGNSTVRHGAPPPEHGGLFEKLFG